MADAGLRGFAWTLTSVPDSPFPPFAPWALSFSFSYLLIRLSYLNDEMKEKSNRKKWNEAFSSNFRLTRRLNESTGGHTYTYIYILGYYSLNFFKLETFRVQLVHAIAMKEKERINERFIDV